MRVVENLVAFAFIAGMFFGFCVGMAHDAGAPPWIVGLMGATGTLIMQIAISSSCRSLRRSGLLQ